MLFTLKYASMFHVCIDSNNSNMSETVSAINLKQWQNTSIDNAFYLSQLQLLSACFISRWTFSDNCTWYLPLLMGLRGYLNQLMEVVCVMLGIVEDLYLLANWLQIHDSVQ